MSKRKRVTPKWRIVQAGHPNRGTVFEEARHDKRTITLRRPDLTADWRRNDPSWRGSEAEITYPRYWLERAG